MVVRVSISGVVFAAIAIAVFSANAAAESKKSILDALKEQGPTRQAVHNQKNLTKNPVSAQLNELRKSATRGFSDKERTLLSAMALSRPSIDLTIYFEYNSADITEKSASTIAELGRALTHPDFRGVTFLVAGHTDAAGGEDYNKALSERRAQSVKKRLHEIFGVSQEYLFAVGYGEEQLKNTANENAAENRRVQVVNLGR